MTRDMAIYILDGAQRNSKRNSIRNCHPITREQVEKMRGTWIEVSDVDGCTWSKCSDCQEDLDSLEDAYDFCPNCGAKMEGGHNP